MQEQKDLWNAALEERISAYQKTGKTVSFYDQCKSLTELRRDCPEHRQFDAFCQRSALNRLHKAFQAFFRRVKAGETPGFPRFKSINRVKSFETSQFSIHRQGVFYSVAIKGIGRFRFKGELPDAKCKNLRVVKTAKRIQVQIACELPSRLALVDTRPEMGMDLGVECLYALSNGETAPRMAVDNSEVKRWQRKVSKAEKGSNNREKKRRSLAKAHQTRQERAHGQLHEISRRLIKEHTAWWSVEDLNIQAMTAKGKHGLNRSILEQEWGRFINILAYKAESAGGRVRKVNAAYTSKTCNKCGGVNHHMGRREHLHCIYCGHKDHRDVNAAKNMLLGDLVSQAGGASRHARGKAVTAGLLTASA